MEEQKFDIKTEEEKIQDSEQIIALYAPNIYTDIKKSDSLLKEVAESTLALFVIKSTSGDLKFVARFIAEQPLPPLSLIEAAEERYLQLKRVILKARGDADVHALAETALNTYCPNIVAAIKNDQEDRLIKKAAETALSKGLIYKKGADYNFCKLYLSQKLDDENIVNQLQNAELEFIDVRGLLSTAINDFTTKDSLGNASVIRRIQNGISQLNIFFVLLLIAGLAWSAVHLPQQALALVSASIGSAITHLLSERNAVLSQANKNKNNNNNNNNNNNE